MKEKEEETDKDGSIERMGLDESLMQLQLEGEKRFQRGGSKLGKQAGFDAKQKRKEVVDATNLSMLFELGHESMTEEQKQAPRLSDGKDLVDFMMGNADSHFH